MAIADDTKARLLEAAGEEFAARGFERAGVRTICDRAGVKNLAAISYHFGSKEQLYVEAVVEAHRCATQLIPESAFARGTPAEHLRRFVHTFLGDVMSMSRDDRWHNTLILREMLQPTAASDVLVREAIRPRFERLVAILRRACPRADVRRLHAMAFSVVGQCLHYKTARPISERLVGVEAYEALDLDYLTDHITSFCLAALGLGPRCAGSKVVTATRARGGCDDVVDRAEDAGRRPCEVLRDRPGADLRRDADHAAGVDLLRPDVRTAGQVYDITGADLWVMDANVRYIDDVKPMIENNLYRVRGVEGVEWAVPLYKGNGRAKINSYGVDPRDKASQRYEVIEQVILLGVDDSSMIGGPTPRQMIVGRLADLRKPDAVIVDFTRLRKLYPGEDWCCWTRSWRSSPTGPSRSPRSSAASPAAARPATRAPRRRRWR